MTNPHPLRIAEAIAVLFSRCLQRGSAQAAAARSSRLRGIAQVKQELAAAHEHAGPPAGDDTERSR